MKKTLILAAGCGLLASVAFAQTPPAGSAPAAQDFVNKVAISDMFEIQSSQLALSKQADADTNPFAEKMVQDHQKTSNELKALVDGGKAKLPTALDAEHQKLLDDLKAKNGKDFDQSYDQAQLKGHRDAVALFEAYDGGKTQVAPRSNWGRPPDEEPANGQVRRRSPGDRTFPSTT
jgi:putative membrane protein